MSLLTQASLILTPNAYKTSKLYSIVPTSGNGDMTVVRATTATRTNSNQLIETVGTNIPRLNYDSNGSASILLEPQRTNLMTYSQDFTNSKWDKNSTSIVSSNNLSPNGTLTATRLTTTDTINPTLQQVITGTISASYTTSFWVRRISGTAQIYLRAGSLDAININPTSEWKLFSATGSSTTTTIRCGVGILNPIAGTDVIEIWGAQLEQGAYPTSYIPTIGTALTRNGDSVVSGSVTDLIGQTEGVLFVESAALFNDLTSREISISDGTNNNRITLLYNTSSNTITLAGVSSGSSIFSAISHTLTDETQFAKIAIRYSNTLGYSLWVNGVNRGSNGATTMPISLNKFGFDRGAGVSSFFYGKVKQLQLYKTALTDAECASLTTL